MTRELLVEGESEDFKISIPDDARVTFGPFSPPTKNEDRYDNTKKLAGTLRVYSKGTKTTENILAVFTRVTGFRDLSKVDYAKKVAVQEGSTMWKSDQNGYVVEERMNQSEAWQKSDSTGLLETSKEDD